MRSRLKASSCSAGPRARATKSCSSSTRPARRLSGPASPRIPGASRACWRSGASSRGSFSSTVGLRDRVRVLVNGVRLFFDVDGSSLVPDGPAMRERPTVVLLHGGPGFDHSIYKPVLSSLADIAQVVFLDQRGNGRSDPGPRESWTLAQWGDDVRGFCEALGIDRPIVLGMSFGGMVALAYATRHPAHPAKVILGNTEAAGGTYRERRVALFERFGGPEAGALARRRFLEGQTDAATLETWVRVALPLYSRSPRDPDAIRRAVRH